MVPQVDASCTEKNLKDDARKSNRLSLKMTNPFSKRRSQPPPAEGEEQKPASVTTGKIIIHL